MDLEVIIAGGLLSFFSLFAAVVAATAMVVLQTTQVAVIRVHATTVAATKHAT